MASSSSSSLITPNQQLLNEIENDIISDPFFKKELTSNIKKFNDVGKTNGLRGQCEIGKTYIAQNIKKDYVIKGLCLTLNDVINEKEQIEKEIESKDKTILAYENELGRKLPQEQLENLQYEDLLKPVVNSNSLIRSDYLVKLRENIIRSRAITKTTE